MTLLPIQQFNDDLLITDDDQKLATERFPTLFTFSILESFGIFF